MQLHGGADRGTDHGENVEVIQLVHLHRGADRGPPECHRSCTSLAMQIVAWCHRSRKKSWKCASLHCFF